MMKFAGNFAGILERSVVQWKIVLTAMSGLLCEVGIRRRIPRRIIIPFCNSVVATDNHLEEIEAGPCL